MRAAVRAAARATVWAAAQAVARAAARAGGGARGAVKITFAYGIFLCKVEKRYYLCLMLAPLLQVGSL